MRAEQTFVRKALQSAKAAQAAEYNAEQHKRYDLYHGEYKRYLLAKLQKLNPKTWEEFSAVYVDLLRMVVDRRAGGLYAPEPQRTFLQDGEAVSDDVAAKAQALLDAARINAVMDKASRYAQLHRTVCVRAAWRHGRVELDVLPPMHWSVVQGNPDPTALDDCEAWILQNAARTDTPGAADEIRDTVWTWYPDSPGNRNGVPQWFVVDADGNVIDQGDNPYYVRAGDDGMGYAWIVPVAVLRYEDPDRAFFLHGGGDLTDAALHVAYELTDIARTLMFQSHGQPVFNGMEPDAAARMILSPTRGMGLGEDQDFKYVSPGSEGIIEKRLDALRQYLAQLAHTYNLPADTFDDHRQPESGVARRIANGPLNSARDAWAERLTDFEADLFRRMLVVHNRQALQGALLPENLTLHSSFPKQTTPLDPSEQLDVDEREIAMGVTSPVDVIMRKYGMGRDEARERYAENVQDSKGVGATGLRAAVQARIAERKAAQGSEG